MTSIIIVSTIERNPRAPSLYSTACRRYIRRLRAGRSTAHHHFEQLDVLFDNGILGFGQNGTKCIPVERVRTKLTALKAKVPSVKPSKADSKFEPKEPETHEGNARRTADCTRPCDFHSVRRAGRPCGRLRPHGRELALRADPHGKLPARPIRHHPQLSGHGKALRRHRRDSRAERDQRMRKAADGRQSQSTA